MRGIVSKNWRWIERGVIPFISAVMQVACFAPLLQFALHNQLVGPEGLSFPWYWMLALLLGASLFERIIQEHPKARIISALTGLGVIIVVLVALYRIDVGSISAWLKMLFYDLTSFEEYFPGALIIIVAAALIWRRGLVADWQSYEQLFKSFLIGTLVLALTVLIAPQDAWSQLGMNPWVSMGIFICSSLLALGLLGVQEATIIRQNEDSPLTLSRYWLGVVASVILAVGVLGFLVSRIASPEGINQVSQVLQPVWDIIKQGISYILLAIAYIAFWALGPLLGLLEENYSESFQEVANRVGDSLQDDYLDMDPAATEPNLVLQKALQILFITAIVVVLIVIFSRALRRRRKKKNLELGEERESVLTGKLLQQQIRDVLQNLRRKPKPIPYLNLEGEQGTRKRIRLSYQRFLAKMTSRGEPRPAGKTPEAYAKMLSASEPEKSQALHNLASAYDIARYASDEPPEELAKRAEEAESSIS